jgi:hypothetical protein
MRARTYPAAPRSVNLTCPRISVVMPGASCIGGRVRALSHDDSVRRANESALIEAGMSGQSDPRRVEASHVDPNYYYRRSLSLRELVPAVGAAIGAGLLAFYVAKLFIERTPLRAEPRAGKAPRLTLHRSGPPITARNVGR